MSKPRPALAPRLRQIDREVEERGMPSAAHARVAAHLRAEADRRRAAGGFRLRWMPAFTFAAGAALVLLVVHLGLRSQRVEAPQVAQADLRVLGGFTVEGDDCTAQVETTQTVLSGTCRLAAPQLAVHTWERTALRRDDHLAVLGGSAMFDVETVEPEAEPVRIAVSHGTIEVLGTRFTIEQREDGGYVDLFEGRIRFVPFVGDVVEILPGQRHSWGAMAEVAALEVEPPEASASAAGVVGLGLDPEPSEPVEPIAEPATRTRRARPRSKSTEATPEPTATEIIDIVAQHRAAGRYAEAVKVLRKADRSSRWDRRTAQVLSYELGEIMSRHMSDVAAACAHWERHEQRFVGGRYTSAVRAAQERLHCSAR